MASVGKSFLSLGRATLLALFILGAAVAAAPQREGVEDRAEAQAAFELINRIRKDPAAYGREIGINLSRYAQRPALVWNDTIYQVALAKAQDMAKRGYFGHVDTKGNGINILLDKAGYGLPPQFIKPRSNNFFESIHAGADSAEGAVRDLIVDKGVNPPGHRLHLLGDGPLRANAVDAAIAFVRCPDEDCEYQSYMVVIIAKHGF